MLTLEIEPVEYYNDETETFESRGGGTIRLEHSLLAMSKMGDAMEASIPPCSS